MYSELQTIVNHAKNLTGFSDEDGEIIKNARAELIDLGPDLAEAFYDQLYSYAPTREVFEGLLKTREAREAALVTWYESLLSGEYDDSFWEWQWFVGLVHIRYKVANTFMLSMMCRIETVLTYKCWEVFEADSAAQVSGAILRLTCCISSVIAEGFHIQYMDAIERGGLKKSLVDRMVSLEVESYIKSAREKYSRA